MRIAICSLCQFTHIVKFVDAAQLLIEKNEVCYFLGFACQDTIRLLQEKQLPYKVLLDEKIDMNFLLTLTVVNESAYAVFEKYFFRYAKLTLPYLIKALNVWRPDFILSDMRDYAGMTAAEIMDIPMVSSGNFTSPFRVEGIDPPFGSGINRDAPKRLLQLMWKLHHEFNDRLDLLYNETIRRPYGLDDIRRVSTLNSTKLVLLSTISILANKYSQDPSYVKYIGPLSLKKGESVEVDETDKIACIASSPEPRVFVTHGTVLMEPLTKKCLKALKNFPGTVIVSLGGKKMSSDICSLLKRKNVIWSSFFFDMNSVLKLVDVVVASEDQTAIESFAAGKPLVFLPERGIQYALAYRFQSLGVAEVCFPRHLDAQKIANLTWQVATEDRYRKAASVLQEHIKQSGGADEVVRLLNHLFD
jgi:UDP:flavonoid glycosyltransferase YjiC (YdhE family)